MSGHDDKNTDTSGGVAHVISHIISHLIHTSSSLRAARVDPERVANAVADCLGTQWLGV